MERQAPRQIRTIVAENIRAARLAAGLTQRELALRVNDVDKLAIYRWESEAVLPNPENLAALAVATDREVQWFYTDHADDPDLTPAA